MILFSCVCLGFVQAAGERDTTEVPIEIAGNIVLAPVSVNGSEELLFIVDSGASETILVPAAAERLGVRCSGGTAGMKRATLGSLAAGAVSVRNLGVMVFEPVQALPLRLDSGVNYQGILGYSFLSKFAVTIDYQRMTLRLVRSDDAERPVPDRNGANVVKFFLSGRIPVLPVSLNGRPAMNFWLDTGSAEVVVFPAEAESAGIRALSSDGPKGFRFGFAERMQVGGASASDVPVVIANLRRDGVGAGSVHGILGYPFLSRFRVTLNYRERILVLEEYAKQSAQPDE